MPEEIREYEKRILHVHTSMTSNQGLKTIAKWLDLPLLYHKKRQFEQMMKATETDYIYLTAQLNEIVAEENMEEDKNKNRKVYTVPEKSIIPSGSRDNFFVKGRPNLFNSKSSDNILALSKENNQEEAEDHPMVSNQNNNNENNESSSDLSDPIENPAEEETNDANKNDNINENQETEEQENNEQNE